MTRCITWLLLVLLAASQVGCACTPEAEPRQIKVHLDETLASQDSRGLVEIDLVFVNDTELDGWRAMSGGAINQYFGGADDRRNDADKITFLFPEGGATRFERTKREVKELNYIPDRAMMHLVILARLPRGRTDAEFINLNKCLWRERSPEISWIDVTVGREEIKVQPFTD